MSHYEREIVELHEFFQAWFNGDLPDTDASFQRFAGTMGPDFAIVSPGGQLSGRDPLLKGLRSMHNARQGSRIWIENVVLRQEIGDMLIVTYEEWQQTPDTEARGRLSTVVFQKQAGLPNDLLWLHVHETWLPQG